MIAAVTLPNWVHAVTAVAWAAASIVALVDTIRLPHIRRSPWIAVRPPLALLSSWWAWLNVARWHGAITTVDYRDAVAPLVPALYVLWTACTVTYVARARRSERLTSILAGGIPDAHDRYEGES
jgi:hypothetical protein